MFLCHISNSEMTYKHNIIPDIDYREKDSQCNGTFYISATSPLSYQGIQPD